MRITLAAKLPPIEVVLLKYVFYTEDKIDGEKEAHG
jgi:hypothetical protein